MSININDPRITQYALGEMSEQEVREFENEIKDNNEILQEIEEIKNFSVVLDEGFKADPKLNLSDARKNTVKEKAEERKAKPSNQRMIIKFIFSAAAGLLLCFVVLNNLNKKELDDIRDAKLEFSKSNIKSKEYFEPGAVGKKKIAQANSEKDLKEVSNLMSKKNAEVEDRIRQTKHPRPPRIPATEENRPKPCKKSRKTHVFASIMKREVPKIDRDGKKVSFFCIAPDPGFNTSSYDHITENAFKKVMDSPLSTFSIDVDTASYSNVRRFINGGSLPPVDAVRIEELINYFNYEYPVPEDKPFSVNFEMASCPWNTKHRLVKIGLKGKEIARENRPSSNLVFLLDVSGSMSSHNKLPLLKKSMKLLLEQLGENDRVSIVVYAGASGLVLPSTTADKKEEIMSALDRLNAGGSTNGGAGIQLAYKTAIANFIEGGVNRVILATDGDFNVGITDEGSLVRLIEKSAKSGVFLSVLGFGMGNYKDSNLEKLSGKGNGNYAYIDTLNEAKKVLVNEMGSTLITIAKDVKIQVEFNPNLVKAYRLVGYENRMLKKEDFNDDKKDAGEIGAGHTVTAFYEIVPNGVEINTPKVDPLKYQKNPKKEAESNFSNEIMTVKLRYKEPSGSKSKLIVFPLQNSFKEYSSASDDFKFASAVAEFGMLLRNSRFKGDATFGKALELANEGLRNDKFGYKKEFISLLKKAMRLKAVSE